METIKDCVIEIAQLKAENAELRSEIAELKMELERYAHGELKMQMRE